MDEKVILLRQIAQLKLENLRLKGILEKNNLEYNFKKSEDIKSESSLLPMSMEEKYKIFVSMFKGRSDVFSRRSARPDPKTGKYGYYAQKDYYSGAYRRLSGYDIVNHLKGVREDCSDVIGIYPVLADETCYFLVFDFDNHEMAEDDNTIREEVKLVRQICIDNGVSHLVERSRSGSGYHLWLFFEEPIEASVARDFGAALLARGSKTVNLFTFKTFDRMIPASDHLPVNHKTGKVGIGNMVALPLQGRALKHGNSAFVDENLEPYEDQWGILAGTNKLSRDFIEQRIREWGKITDAMADDAPWEVTEADLCASDVDGAMCIVIADRIYIDKRNIRPYLQNQLRRMAAFNNSEFFKRQAMGFSTHNIARIVYCGEDSGNYICLPRGLFELLVNKLDDSEIKYQVVDRRSFGDRIKVKFKGNLFAEQREAAEAMLAYDNGILSAATAFGKTVLGAYLISKRKVNTLILVHNYEIMKNWQKDLESFLEIDGEIPVKLTKKGRRKKLKSIVGTLKSTQDNTTGVVDIAMISSLGKYGEINELVKNYGMVIMDECHHSPNRTSDGVLREIKAKYFYGLTATPIRNDGMKKKMLMTFGPVRYCYSAKDRAKKTKFDYTVRTKTTVFKTDQKEIYDIYNEMIKDDNRNAQIIADTIDAAVAGKTPIVVTRFKTHAEYLHREIKKTIKDTFLLTGGRGNTNALDEMGRVADDGPLVLVATGQYIGEGFNFPRLDTLVIATPISFRGVVEQYAGRINRDYAGKREVVILDYLDSEVPVCRSMYRKRKTAYRAIGYRV